MSFYPPCDGFVLITTTGTIGNWCAVYDNVTKLRSTHSHVNGLQGVCYIPVKKEHQVVILINVTTINAMLFIY